MNKKLIRNTLLLLLIPLFISIVISIININKNSFSTTVNYDNNKNVIINDNDVTYNNDYDELYDDRGIIDQTSRSYTTIMFSGIALALIFIIFYIYLYRKKKW